MDPQAFAQQLRKPEGEAGIAMGRTMNEGNLRMHEHFLDFLTLNDHEMVLEIGFGNGKFIPDILRKNQHIKYSGIDFSEVMVTEALQFITVEQLEAQAEVKWGTVSEIDYPSQYFDRVCTINTVYFWPSPLEDAKEIRRVMKTGGTFYLCFRPKEMAEKLPVTQFGFRLYSLQDALDLLNQAGFRELTYSYREEPEIEMFGEKMTFSSYCIKAMK